MAENNTDREYLATCMNRVAEALSDMYGHWIMADLPADFLSGEEYPFDLALEDLLAKVNAAAESISRPPARSYCIGLPVAITIRGDRVEFDVDLSEVSDIDEDEDAYGRYGEARVDADRVVVSKAADAVRNHYTINILTEGV